MEIDFEYDTTTVLVLPHFSLGFAEFEGCEQEIFHCTIGWLFWSWVLFFPNCTE